MRFMLVFLMTSAVAMAQAPADPLDVCAAKADASARLACFDQEMQRRHATTTGVRPEAAPSAAPLAAPPAAVLPAAKNPKKVTADPADENVGLSGVELRKKLREQGVVEPPKPKPIVAQVERAVWHPDHRYTLVLDNGQVWEQVEGQQGTYVDVHEKVSISSGVLGAFFLENSKHQYLRVRRVQ